MKNTFLTLIAVIMMTTSACAQTDETKAVKETITQFAKAADANNSEELATYLDENYQIAMNQLFGSPDLSIVDRAVYLSKIESKEWGGEKRTIKFIRVDVNGKNASAKVEMKGAKMTMVSYLILVQNKNGKWKLVYDVPTLI